MTGCSTPAPLLALGLAEEPPELDEAVLDPTDPDDADVGEFDEPDEDEPDVPEADEPELPEEV